MKTEEECWLCLRITPEEILNYSHKVWKDKKIARKITKTLSKLIKVVYSEYPTYFCAKTKKRIIGSGLYLLGQLLDSTVNQRDVADSLDITSGEKLIGIGFKDWKKVLMTIPKEKLPTEIREKIPHEKWKKRELVAKLKCLKCPKKLKTISGWLAHMRFRHKIDTRRSITTEDFDENGVLIDKSKFVRVKPLKPFKPWKLSKHQQAMRRHGIIDEYGKKVKES